MNEEKGDSFVLTYPLTITFTTNESVSLRSDFILTFAFYCHIVVCILRQINPYPDNISDFIKVSTLDTYNTPKKDNPAESTFLGVALDPEGLPVGIFKSLASMIGLYHTKTKLCPFCEETIKEEACACRYCNRILMKPMNLKTRR